MRVRRCHLLLLTWVIVPSGCESRDKAGNVHAETTEAGPRTDDARVDSATDARTPDAALPATPGGKHNFSVVYGNLDSSGTTWARHATLTFSDDGSVSSTYWHWESSLQKGKTAHTSHRCTFDGVTKECAVYVPTGWIDPAKMYTNRSGTFGLSADARQVELFWADGQQETWSIDATSTPTLAMLSFQTSNSGITHGAGFGSNASWQSFRTLQEIATAGGLKRWAGKSVGASSSDGTAITPSDWRNVSLDLSSFTSASQSSEGYTLHAMLPHSSKVCTGGCSGERTGFIMYHLASTNQGRQMAYNNWCTCLSIAGEWPCYNRNMHPWAFMSIIDDNAVHRGWLFVEQQNQTGYDGYQYQLGYFTDL